MRGGRGCQGQADVREEHSGSGARHDQESRGVPREDARAELVPLREAQPQLQEELPREEVGHHEQANDRHKKEHRAQHLRLWGLTRLSQPVSPRQRLRHKLWSLAATGLEDPEHRQLCQLQKPQELR